MFGEAPPEDGLDVPAPEAGKRTARAGVPPVPPRRQRRAKLRDLEDSKAIAPLYQPEVGDIDLIWGKEGDAEKDYKNGFGLAHILVRKNRLPIVDNLQAILGGMKIHNQAGHKIRLTDGKYWAVVSSA